MLFFCTLTGPQSETPPAFYFFIVLGSIVFGYLRVRFSESPFIKRNFKQFLILRDLEKIYRPYLSQYFHFYNCLDQKNKILFERRVQKFIDMKEFIPRGGLQLITPEMKAMIAGSAIQITFGYPNIYFRYFCKILIYPDNYYSTITHQYHKGEVNRRGIIVLSWHSFKAGFSNLTDGINLGYHEMAHALRLINIVANEEYDFYDQKIMNEFEMEAKSEIIKIINSPHETSLFRNYSTTNIDEFFSVAIECFFEKSSDFKDYNLKLYQLLTKILKIDPEQLFLESKTRSIAS